MQIFNECKNTANRYISPGALEQILLQVWFEKFYFSCLVAFIVYSWAEVTVGIDYNPEKAFEAFPLVFIRR